jgi:hypothetical protein
MLRSTAFLIGKRVEAAASAAAGVAKNPRRVIKAFSVQRSAFSEGGLLTAEC